MSPASVAQLAEWPERPEVTVSSQGAHAQVVGAISVGDVQEAVCGRLSLIAVSISLPFPL